MQQKSESGKLVSQAEYARIRGLAKSTVSRQVRSGVIPLVNGKIDPAAADLAREGNLNPARRLAAACRKSAHRQQPSRVVEIGSRPGSLAHAQLKIAEVKAKRAALELAALEGKLISADEVRAVEMERATAEREALLNWPSSGIAVELAAKFNVSERDMFLALDVEVRHYLEKRSQQPLDQIARADRPQLVVPVPAS
jgi:hypothetical protein